MRFCFASRQFIYLLMGLYGPLKDVLLFSHPSPRVKIDEINLTRKIVYVNYLSF